MGQNLDLLGDPIPVNFGKRGRPPHIPTEQNRNKVRLLLAFGWANPVIAKALRITAPTLRQHYSSELKHRDEARPALEAAHKMAIYKAAVVDGNVGALKELGRMIEHDGMARALPGTASRDSTGDPPRPPPLGKKAAADQAAESAEKGTGWQEVLH